MIFDYNGKIVNDNDNKAESNHTIYINNEGEGNIYFNSSNNNNSNNNNSNNNNRNNNNNNNNNTSPKSKRKIPPKIIVAIISTIGIIIAALIPIYLSQKIEYENNINYETHIEDESETGDTITSNSSFLIPVPNVVGNIESDAEEILSNGGFNYKIVKSTPILDKGSNAFSYYVITKQSPKSGEYIDANAYISLEKEERVYYSNKPPSIFEAEPNVLKEMSTDAGKFIVHDSKKFTAYIYSNFTNENCIGKIDGIWKIKGWCIEVYDDYRIFYIKITIDDTNNTFVVKFYNTSTDNFSSNLYIKDNEIILQANFFYRFVDLSNVQNFTIEPIWEKFEK